jgi:DNA-binding beta-propeller fold protein YncE
MLAATTALWMSLWATHAPAAAEPNPPKFTAKPTATKAGDKVKIEFAVDRETDVAVFVEDGGGKVVRHLVAGVLGKNPPPPLKPGLAQSVEWDGKADYGKDAGAGPFKVRVALGLGAKYDKVLVSEPNSLFQVKSLATGPDGTLYVLNAVGVIFLWPGEEILAFNRDGQYERTISPFPTNLKLDQVKGFDAFEVEGRPTAMVGTVQRLQLFPGDISPRKTGMTVTPDGKAVLRLTGVDRISAVGALGEAVWSNPGGPKMLAASRPTVGRGFVCAASDGKRAFVTGLGENRPGKKPESISYASVEVVKLPERGPAEPFFGKPEEPGADQSHLGEAPRGLAVDGKGNLFIADYKNDRVVVVTETDGKFVGEFKVPKPDGLGVDPRTGAVYVLSKDGWGDLVKFSPSAGSGPGGGWKDPKESARIALGLGGNPLFPPSMAVDATATPPVVWIGTDLGALLRIEDLGGKFGEPKNVSNNKAGNSAYTDVTVDRLRKEVYVRGNTAGPTWWWRFSEETGKLEQVKTACESGGGQGVAMIPAPDGNLYALRYPYCLFKWDRNGKPSPWEIQDNPTTYLDKEGKPLPLGKMDPCAKYVPVSETEVPHGLGVRWSDGHLFVLQPGQPGSRPPKALHEYLPSGKRVTTDPIIWKVSDAALAPRFDAAGNIYIAEHVTPPGWYYPPELQKVLGPIKGRAEGLQSSNAAMYGSILKFGPKGGMVHSQLVGLFGGYNPFDGEPKLDPTLKSTETISCLDGATEPIKVTGAEWIHPGISHVGVYGCTCENVTFDVDEFGRVFFPDTNLFRVGVIDTAGNALTYIGGYGNAESMGPDSPVIDAKTGKVRARLPADPKDLKSPFAEPEIAFAWLVGVAATDKYVYTGDSINRRMLRSKIVYAAEESCPVP